MYSMQRTNDRITSPSSVIDGFSSEAAKQRKCQIRKLLLHYLGTVPVIYHSEKPQARSVTYGMLIPFSPRVVPTGLLALNSSQLTLEYGIVDVLYF